MSTTCYEYASGYPRYDVWQWDGSALEANGTLMRIERELPIEQLELSGSQRLRVVDLGHEPNIRVYGAGDLTLAFEKITRRQVDRMLRDHAFDKSIALEIGIYASDTEGTGPNPGGTITGWADQLEPATGLSNYVDRKWYFGTYPSWKSGSVNVYVDTGSGPAGPYGTGHATYGHTVNHALGAIQTTTPANWLSNYVVYATYDWAPTVKVDSVTPEPIPGTRPPLFDCEVRCSEQIALYG